MKKAVLLSVFIVPAVLFVYAGTKSGKNHVVKAPKGFVFIPLASTNINGKARIIQPFFMSETEVTNGQYQEFLGELKKQGKLKEFATAKPDNALWGQFDAEALSGYMNEYDHKPDYPVVNISTAGAELYCKWLSSKYPGYDVEFRLPTYVEWEYAARGGYYDKPFPWGGECLKNQNGYLAQFRALGSVYGPVAVKTFHPNDFALYDMTGNVSEMVSDTNVVRGGSWNNSGDEIRITRCGKYSVSPMVGFRPVISYIPNK